MTRSMKVALVITGLLLLLAAVSYLSTPWSEFRQAIRLPRQTATVGPRREPIRLKGEKELLGNPEAPVKVWMIVAPAACWDDVVVLMRDMAQQYPEDLYIEMYDMVTEQGKQQLEAKAMSCAGLQVNGKTDVTLKMPDGTERTVMLDKSPGHLYSLDDLRMALEQTLEKARGGEAKTATSDANGSGAAGVTTAAATTPASGK